MAVSQNGWLANDRSVITSFSIGNNTKVSLRSGDAGFLLQHFANWFDQVVQDIDGGQLDDWGYAERPIRGGVELSNHASGTAIDLNATKWALGSPASRNLNGIQIAQVRAQLKLYEGAIRWGGDYTGRTDPMHFEINVNAAFVARIATKLRGANTPVVVPVGNSVPPFPLPQGQYFGLITGPAASHGGFYAEERVWIKVIQQSLIRQGYVPGISAINSGWADGKYEQATADAVTRFQRKEMPGTTFYGQVWADDWKKLLS